MQSAPFLPFLNDDKVELYGMEAGGKGMMSDIMQQHYPKAKLEYCME